MTLYVARALRLLLIETKRSSIPFHNEYHLFDFSDPAHDWSWRIRYTAVQGLVQICGHLAGNKMCDGLYNIAWRSLLEANSFESDERVLEALKVGQVSFVFVV